MTTKNNIILFVILCLTIIIYEKYRWSQIKMVDLSTRIPITSITDINDFNRGDLYIKDNLLLATHSLILVENKDNYHDWLYNSSPKLGSKGQLPKIRPPYYIKKQPNNDTIIVVSVKHTLKFLMQNELENQNR